MKDYLDSEIADLKLTIDGKIPYQTYLQTTKQRDDKLTYLYMSNKAFVAELLKLKAQTNSAVVRLVNKTSAISLFQACTQNVDLCEKF